MEKINKAKEDVINRFTQVIDGLFSSDLFSEITKLQTLISQKEERLSDLNSEYSDLESSYKKIKVSWDERESFLKNYDKSLLERENIVTGKESEINEKLTLADDFVKDKLSQRNSIIKEIEGFLPELEKIRSLKQQGEEAKKNLDLIRKEIIEETAHLSDIQTKFADFVSQFNKAKLTATKELELIREEKERDRKSILPTLEDLDNRSKKLDEREAGIDIIEARWKKIYADKGVGFRV